MIKHLTVRGVDGRTEAEIKSLAARRGVSINKAALALIRKGAGIPEEGQGPEVISHALDRFIGCWSLEQEREVLNTVADLGQIDAEHWQ